MFHFFAPPCTYTTKSAAIPHNNQKLQSAINIGHSHSVSAMIIGYVITHTDIVAGVNKAFIVSVRVRLCVGCVCVSA